MPSTQPNGKGVLGADSAGIGLPSDSDGRRKGLAGALDSVIPTLQGGGPIKRRAGRCRPGWMSPHCASPDRNRADLDEGVG